MRRKIRDDIVACQANLVRRVLVDQAPCAHWCVIPSEEVYAPQIIIECHMKNGGWRHIWNRDDIDKAFMRKPFGGDTPLNEKGFQMLAELAARAIQGGSQ